VTAAGEPLDKEQAERLLSLPGRVTQPEITLPAAMIDPLDSLTKLQEADRHQIITKRNAAFFEAETEKLDRWAEDLKVVLEREIKELDRQIREAKRAATAGLTLEEKLAGQKQVKELEKLRSQKRRSLFEAQDQVDEQRDRLIAEIEGKLEQESELKPLFTISWKLG
jgi:adenine-specific DNA-methyltransferase